MDPTILKLPGRFENKLEIRREEIQMLTEAIFRTITNLSSISKFKCFVSDLFSCALSLFLMVTSWFNTVTLWT